MVISMDRWVGKVAVVTGASSGIGAAVAERLVHEGLKVVGLARRKEKLEALQKKLSGLKGKFYPFQTDLTKEEDIVKAFKWVKENVGPVHILINNAGVGGDGYDSSISTGKSEHWKAILDTNVLALSSATREAVASMKNNKVDGHIVNLSSVVGHMVPNVPGFSMYTASKHAATALAEAIRLELVNANSKIRITNVSPGVVLTEFTPENNPFIQQLIKENKYLRAEDISDAIIYALSTPPHVQVHELMIKPVGEPM